MIKELSLHKGNLVAENGFPVMMPWEKPYMEHCINMLFPVGDVLEIGFGLGYSATQIQKFPIRSHTIIECDNNVVVKAREWANNQPHPVNIIHGKWQEMMALVGRFDSIFFDDCFLTEHPYEHNMSSIKYFVERINQLHSKELTKIGWYCESVPSENLQDYFKRIGATFELYNFKINKPKNLEYAKKHGDVMFVPQLTLT